MRFWACRGTLSRYSCPCPSVGSAQLRRAVPTVPADVAQGHLTLYYRRQQQGETTTGLQAEVQFERMHQKDPAYLLALIRSRKEKWTITVCQSQKMNSVSLVYHHVLIELLQKGRARSQ